MTQSNPIDTDEYLHPGEIAEYIDQLLGKAEEEDEACLALAFSLTSHLAWNYATKEIALNTLLEFTEKVKELINKYEAEEQCMWNYNEHDE